jgi:hypothetical protein
MSNSYFNSFIAAKQCTISTFLFSKYSSNFLSVIYSFITAYGKPYWSTSQLSDGRSNKPTDVRTFLATNFNTIR